MANAREIQARMKSIKDTMKITNAMYMISSSKLQKARRDLKNTEPYFYTIQDCLSKILELSPDAGNVYFDEREDVPKQERKQGYIVVTARMVNSVTFDAEIKQLLPLKKVKFERTEEHNKYKTCTFEPSMNAVFDHIIPNYISGFVYGALVESYCSEHNARMMAMQTATDAAKDMLKGLGIEYNRARQAAITQEITEVIAGAKAQKMKED